MGAGASQPPRSVSAQSAGAASALARQRRADPNGWWGMALFLGAEVTLFGTLIASYFYLDFDAHGWPPAPIKAPSVVVPLVSVGFLVATSLPMALSARAARGGRRGPVIRLIVGAFVIQAAYLAVQIVLVTRDLNKFLPSGGAYGSVYYTLGVTHDAHVALGLLLDLAVVWQLVMRGLTNYWLIGVRCIALYWHVVNVLAVLVVLTQLSPTL